MGYVFHFTAMMAFSTTLFFMTYAATTEIPATSTSEIKCELVDCQSGFVCIDTELGPRCIMPQNVCELPSDSGPCLAYMPRYFYNSTSAKCEQFIYGGCQGNANRFMTEVDCYGTCGQCPFFPAVVVNCERNDTCSLTGPNVCPTNTKCCSTPCGNACLSPS